jgi:PAS domain-containing protein
MVMIADRDGLTEWVNQAFITHTGYTLADMRGKNRGVSSKDRIPTGRL